MPDLRKDILKLRDSELAKKAQLASSPYVLRKIIAEDPAVRRLISAGESVVPIIADIMKSRDDLDEITLAAFAYIVEQVDAEATPKILGPRFRLSVKKPGPFFVHFAAHAIRAAKHLPLHEPHVAYSHDELVETRRTLE